MAQDKPAPGNTLEFPETWLQRDVTSRFDFVADILPDHTAIFTAGRSLSYRQLQTASCRLARSIETRAGGGSATVSILQDNDLDSIVSILAVLRAGKRYIALDPSVPAASNLATLQHGEAVLLLVDAGTAEQAVGTPLSAVPAMNVQELPQENDGSALNLAAGPDADAAIFYTSGTTGTPKGVVKTHRTFNYRAYIDQLYYGITPDDRICSLFHNQHAASVGAIFSALLNGASYTPYHVHRQGLNSLGDFLAGQQITILRPPMSLMRAFLDSRQERIPVPHMRFFSLTGDMVKEEHINSYHRVFQGDYLLAHQYSVSEAGAIARHNISRGFQMHRESVPLGTMMPFMEVLILDPEHNPLPAGETGEIAIRSSFLPAGYWRDPEKTREKYLPDQDGKGRICLSGDLGYVDSQGALYIVGRRDEQVKIRGHRVNLRIIETILQKQGEVHHPVAVPFTEPHGDVALVVCYLKQPGKSIDIQDLRARMLQELPPWMVPSHFVEMEKYPDNAAGKIDRNTLMKQVSVRLNPSDTATTNQPEIESSITGIWEKYLNVTPVGPDDDFFDLGGHSLAAIQILGEVERLYGRRIPIGALLEIRTVRNLTRELSGDAPHDRLLVPIRAEGDKTPLFFAPGITGDVFYLRNLLPYLSEIQPLYGLQPPGMGNAQAPLTSIPEIAAELIEAVKTLQPEGPYLLAGHSFGGFYVFEMARQLLSRGEKISLLAILDTYAPEVRLNAPPLVRAGLHLQNLKGKSPSAVKAYLQTRLRNLRLKLLRYTVFQYLFRLSGYHPADVRSANKIAKHGYSLQPYPGKLTFFRISSRPSYLKVDPTSRWQEIAAEYDLIEMPGEHGTMLDEPNVQILGRELERILTALQRGDS